MSKLRPTLWRTCRAIASETRLRLFWEIFRGKDLSVSMLAHRVGISEQNASNQLRVLNARALITPYRKGMKVFYRAEANREVEYAEELLEALRNCCAKKGLFTEVRL